MRFGKDFDHRDCLLGCRVDRRWNNTCIWFYLGPMVFCVDWEHKK